MDTSEQPYYLGPIVSRHTQNKRRITDSDNPNQTHPSSKKVRQRWTPVAIEVNNKYDAISEIAFSDDEGTGNMEIDNGTLRKPNPPNNLRK